MVLKKEDRTHTKFYNWIKQNIKNFSLVQFDSILKFSSGGSHYANYKNTSKKKKLHENSTGKKLRENKRNSIEPKNKRLGYVCIERIQSHKNKKQKWRHHENSITMRLWSRDRESSFCRRRPWERWLLIRVMKHFKIRKLKNEKKIILGIDILKYMYF